MSRSHGTMSMGAAIATMASTCLRIRRCRNQRVTLLWIRLSMRQPQSTIYTRLKSLRLTLSDFSLKDRTCRWLIRFPKRMLSQNRSITHKSNFHWSTILWLLVMWENRSALRNWVSVLTMMTYSIREVLICLLYLKSNSKSNQHQRRPSNRHRKVVNKIQRSLHRPPPQSKRNPQRLSKKRQ